MFQEKRASDGLGSQVADTQEKLTTEPRNATAGHPSTWVYFMHVAEAAAVKIGTAKNVHDRVGQVQMCCPFQVTLLAYVPGGRDLEKHLHDHFIADRIRGEWFRDTQALRMEIERLCPTDNGLPVWMREMAETLGQIVAPTAKP